jgi:penicillin-binding protein 1B
MPRIDHDEDDLDDDTTGPDWRRRLITWTLAAAGLGLGFLIPYTLYLNHQVGERFGQLRGQIPTRVYSRPLALHPGVAMDAQTLKTELDAAAYRDDGAGVRPGSYARNGGRWLIASRGFFDVDGTVSARRIEVVLSGGRVASVRDAARRESLKVARLDPARIATLYGQQQEERRLVQIEEVPELLVTGLQAVEDRDFAHHHGIDFGGILRAAWVNLRSGAARQGASTLTQQLARSGLLGIGKEQTLTRKFNEVLYAMLIEARYDKRTILEAYFNQEYLAQRGSQAIHGVAAGAEFWFGRDLRDLTTEQIALLIGIVKGPSAYDPRRNPERALERRNFALGKMHETGLINDAEFERANNAPLGVS